MRSAISALTGFALAGSFAFAQPSDGRLKIIHETATLRVAYRTDSRPFSYVDTQGRPVGYTIELCERIARSLEAQLTVGAMIKAPTGYPVQSPYLATANRQVEIMIRIASEFGFTPASRSRLPSPSKGGSMLLELTNLADLDLPRLEEAAG